MPRVRFSLFGMMVGVSYVALLVAAITCGTRLCADLLFSVTLGILLVGLLRAIYHTGEHRAFWTGFTMLGLTYMVLAFGPWCKDNIAPMLVTHEIMMPLQPYLAELHVVHYAEPGFTPKRVDDHTFQTGPRSMFTDYSTVAYTQRTVHCVTAMLLGLMGGSMALRLQKRGHATATAAIVQTPRA